MSNVMESLLADSPVKELAEGSVVNALITSIGEDFVSVDIGTKTDGKIPVSEFNDIIDVEVGAQIEVYLEKLEDKLGVPIISYDKAQQKRNWAVILENCTEGSIVSGKIKSKTKGGLIVNIGIDAFLPGSQIDIQIPRNLDQYIGQTYDFKIVKINQKRKNVVVSRRELLEEGRHEKRQKVLEEINVGDIRRGVVKNITDYGVFVDLDGLDGLLHITDVSWGRVSHPSEAVAVGEEIDVMVLEVDKERERVSLGMKQTVANPWDNIEDKYPIGSKVAGKVVNLVPYGAFVELEQGVEGLVHITEMSWTKRINKPSEVMKVGDIISAVVVGIEKENRKIALGIRQLEENPWEMVKHNYPIGAHVRGAIRNITNYGIFVELESGIDGMIHVSDISWTKKIVHPSDVFKKGDVVDAIVIDIDTNQQKIALGIKQLEKDPWENIDDVFKIGSLVKGKVSKITAYGAFIELHDSIDGLVHISQVSEDRIEKVKDVLQIGDEVSARVIKIDKNERRIGLSIKAANYDQDAMETELRAYENLQNSQNFANLGDVFGGFELESSDEKER
ncbi:MAG: 30S ribosomal protein S1 [Puniceicoccales bacterium]|jgi:small subunit ribosomal protein S1|nr:30S ribosomal protein S1 [Puniceicoccales bacterium]